MKKIKPKMKKMKTKLKIDKSYFYAPYIPIYISGQIGRTFGLLQFYAGLLGLLKKRKEEEDD